MRPVPYDGTESIYACADCGTRQEAPETSVCDECGGTLLNLSSSRDL